MEKANFHDGDTDSEDELNMLMATEAPEEEAQATATKGGSSKKDKAVNLFSKKDKKNQDNPQSGRGANKDNDPTRNIQLKKKWRCWLKSYSN